MNFRVLKSISKCSDYLVSLKVKTGIDRVFRHHYRLFMCPYLVDRKNFTSDVEAAIVGVKEGS
jgi:hypothetical protein